ncbi:MAG: 2-phospho-L-lactate transferase [Acidimicrobiales bacterium]|nr:2-phospho-L-lactate transferase [Acidimicrobiales bacterium]
MTGPTVCVIAGGVGAAKLLAGVVTVLDPKGVTAVVNVGDDLVLHGLHISPDLDTITYTLAGQNNTETGWGLTGETWQAMEMLRRYGGIDWFSLGDRDLGTHLFRTQRIHEGATLSEVTAEITAAWGIQARLLPVTDDRVSTMLTVAEGDEAGREISFQEYFVKRRHEVAVSSVRFDGAATAAPAPGVISAIESAEMLVIAPSNPLVSIDPVMAVPGVRAAIEARSSTTVAVSPIIAGAALKGPADRLLRELGFRSSASQIAELYSPLAATLVIDEADRDLADEVAAAGVVPVVAPTVMHDVGAAADLAETILGVLR